LKAEGLGTAMLLGDQHGTTIHVLVTAEALPRIRGADLAARLCASRPEMAVLYLSERDGDDPADGLQSLARRLRGVLAAMPLA
jgi:hypothetical protein